jgi:folate-dependent phosphoribosylglycinamide formyltransferase PurN
VTIHYIDKGEDTGNIICQERVLISPGEKEPRGDKSANEIKISAIK